MLTLHINDATLSPLNADCSVKYVDCCVVLLVVSGRPRMWQAPLYVSVDIFIIIHFSIFEAAASQEVAFGWPMPTIVVYQGKK